MGMMMRRLKSLLRPACMIAVIAAALAAIPATSFAATVNIVALGASNTYGQGRGKTNGGVNPSHAYPAQLQALLRARGLDARVSNAGIAGDTTSGMLGRLDSAVPQDTSIVILQAGGNDARRGEGGRVAGNVAQIRKRLTARGIVVIMLDHLGRIAPKSSRDPDGQHFDARGHAAFAAYLAPQVMAAAKRKR
jgi:acyl-CoA thioesterase-1